MITEICDKSGDAEETRANDLKSKSNLFVSEDEEIKIRNSEFSLNNVNSRVLRKNEPIYGRCIFRNGENLVEAIEFIFHLPGVSTESEVLVSLKYLDDRQRVLLQKKKYSIIEQ